MKIIYNGINLDDAIQGYETINVEGRGLFAPTLNTIDIDGRDGSYVVSQQLPPRTLTVYFVIRATNNSDKMKVEEELTKKLLVNEDVEVIFDDEEGYYTGRYAAYKDVAFDYFQGIGSFEIYCQDPYRRLQEQSLSGETFTIPNDDVIKFELLEVTGDVNTNEVAIRNESLGHYIYLTNITDFGDLKLTKNTIEINGIQMTQKLDPSRTTWKKFLILPGNNISLQNISNGELKFRELAL